MVRTLNNPLCWVGASYLIFAVCHYLVLARGAPTPHPGLEAVLLGFIAACWISRDPKGNREWPVDHSMAFYLFLFPVYMLVTRGWKGVIWLFLLWLAYGLTHLIPSLLTSME